jgi:hypothetical protein
METTTTFENDVNAFTAHVKELKNLAKCKSPAKSPGSYSSDQIVIGRDGNQWKNARVYHIDTSSGYLDERYVLVWKKI